MNRRIRITTRHLSTLADIGSGKTATAIWEALPIRARANTWGDEVYFSIPVRVAIEDGRDIVSPGDLGYWPPGQAFCIFFGPTPASKGGEIRPASAVHVFGKVLGNPTVFKAVKDGDEVAVERMEEPESGDSPSQ